MRTSSCCVMAVTKAATLTVTNPRSPASQKETGTARPAYPRYLNLLLLMIFFLMCIFLDSSQDLFYSCFVKLMVERQEEKGHIVEYILCI